MSEELDDIEREDEEGLFEHHRIVADKGQGLVRIDKFLVDRLEKTSRSRIQDAHDAGFVKVNGVSVKSSYKIKPNDVITIELPYPVREFEIIPENIPIEILYEDDEVLVINKPMNMVYIPDMETIQALWSMPYFFIFKKHLQESNIVPAWCIDWISIPRVLWCWPRQTMP